MPAFRTIWGPDTYFEMTVPGTDEFIAGNDGNNGLVKYNSNFNTADGIVAGDLEKLLHLYQYL
jgi:hypothetical protein